MTRLPIAEKARALWDWLRHEFNQTTDEKRIRDSILKIIETGSVEHLEVAYNKSSITNEEFYRIFRNTIANFNFLSCPVDFIKKILFFWDKHGLDSRVLEYVYIKWLDYELFFLVNDVDYRFFWKWIFENGMKKFDLSYILENSDIKFKDVIEKIASRNEYIDLVFNKNLDKFLNSVWTAALVTDELSIDEAISTIVRQFPNYEVRVLNHAYYYIIKNFAGFSRASAMIFCVLERMADYEYYKEKPIFSGGEPRIPKNDDGNVNLNAEVERIIYSCCDSMNLRDVVWILENRFNIGTEYIEECMCRVFVELCSRWDLKTVVIGREHLNFQYRAILPAMMQFAAGYRIFLLFFEDLAKKAYREELGMLEEKYGMNIEMNVKF